jgi:type IV pilus assembly protein PilN
MRIGLNLATRPYIDFGPIIKQLRIAIGVLLLCSCGLALGLYSFHEKAVENRNRVRAVDSQIIRLNMERQGYQNYMRQPENAQLLQRINSMNQIFDEKSFSWTLAMEDLETVLPHGVSVSTLEPARDKYGNITVRLRVAGPRDKAVELVRNLERSKRFLLPRIVGENAEASDTPGKALEPISISSRVNFDILADYKPATSDEIQAIVAKLKRQGKDVEVTPQTPVIKPVPQTNNAVVKKSPGTAVPVPAPRVLPQQNNGAPGSPQRQNQPQNRQPGQPRTGNPMQNQDDRMRHRVPGMNSGPNSGGQQ